MLSCNLSNIFIVRNQLHANIFFFNKKVWNICCHMYSIIPEKRTLDIPLKAFVMSLEKSQRSALLSENQEHFFFIIWPAFHFQIVHHICSPWILNKVYYLYSDTAVHAFKHSKAVHASQFLSSSIISKNVKKWLRKGTDQLQLNEFLRDILFLYNISLLFDRHKSP